jgi:integration host factor subunit beta
MVKSKLIERISVQSRLLHERYVAKIVDVILNEITAAMARGDRVELRGFGAFSVKNRAARTGRNPRTQASVSVKEKTVPCFKTGKEMRDRLNKAPPTAAAPNHAHLPDLRRS